MQPGQSESQMVSVSESRPESAPLGPGGQIMDSHWQPEAPSQTQSGIIRLWAPAEVSSESQAQPGGSRWPAGTDSESVRRHCTCKRLQSEAALPDASESRTGRLPGGPAAAFQSVQY